MFIIRDVMIAKPGSAQKLAEMFKSATPDLMKGKVTIMIDFATDFNKIVIEHEVKSLEEFQKMMEDFKKDKKLMEKMKGYTDLYQTGKREIFKVF